MRPTARRQAVGHVMERYGMSQRRACRRVGLSRSVAQYRCKPRNDEALRTRLNKLAARYRRYGYLRLHVLLAKEGLAVNAKRTYRLYGEEGLQVRRRDRLPLPVPDQPMRRWSLDFMSDPLASGRRFRILNIVDDCSRECPGQIVDLSISGERPARFLDGLAKLRGLPESLIMDNGPERTSRAMFEWAQKGGGELHFIETGKPAQNALVESFNGRCRDECLNEEWFVSLAHARTVIEAWRVQYNTARPHSALGYKAPAAYLATRAASRKLRKDSAHLPFRSMITTENSQPTWPYTRERSAGIQTSRIGAHQRESMHARFRAVCKSFDPLQ